MPRRFKLRMRSAISASALRLIQQKLLLASHLARISRGSSRVIRVINEIAPARFGISGDGHGQLAPRAVVNNSPARRNFHGALLLMLRPLFKFAITENLQVNEP